MPTVDRPSTNVFGRIASAADRADNAMLKSGEDLADGAGRIAESGVRTALKLSLPLTAMGASTYFAIDHTIPAMTKAWNAPTDPNYAFDLNKVANVGFAGLQTVLCGVIFAAGALNGVKVLAKAGSKAEAAVEKAAE